jgi:hypothetical protein
MKVLFHLPGYLRDEGLISNPLVLNVNSWKNSCSFSILVWASWQSFLFLDLMIAIISMEIQANDQASIQVVAQLFLNF